MLTADLLLCYFTPVILSSLKGLCMLLTEEYSLDSKFSFVGQYLMRILKEKGLSQNKLAIAIGVTRNAINMLVNKKMKMSEEMANKIGNYLEIDKDILIKLQKQERHLESVRNLN